MGYANILYNKYLYDQALKVYNKVMAIRPSLLNAYVCVMFLHEFKRVEKPKSIAFANTVLSKDPNNMYAHFVLGKNEKDVDEKIKKLTAGALKFPYYIRINNEVGLSYGAKKDHKSAIEWYKKCLQLAPNDYAQGYNNVAFRT
jgi:tetratricopeptide (TPR) repeat protein